jgi:sugar lactone lactonase YvrE
VRPIVPGRKVYVYYLAPGSRFAQVVDDTMVRPNGLALSLDGRTLYVCDTVGHDVFAFDIRADGRLEGRRVFATLRDIKAGDDSGADGMAIDRDGRVYVTTVRGVQMFSRTGEYLGTIPVPRRPTNVAFSGPGKGTLYITAREGLYRIRMLTRGPDRPGKIRSASPLSGRAASARCARALLRNTRRWGSSRSRMWIRSARKRSRNRPALTFTPA